VLVTTVVSPSTSSTLVHTSSPVVVSQTTIIVCADAGLTEYNTAATQTHPAMNATRR
jgi:hypothetical protein